MLQSYNIFKTIFQYIFIQIKKLIFVFGKLIFVKVELN